MLHTQAWVDIWPYINEGSLTKRWCSNTKLHQLTQFPIVNAQKNVAYKLTYVKSWSVIPALIYESKNDLYCGASQVYVFDFKILLTGGKIVKDHPSTNDNIKSTLL